MSRVIRDEERDVLEREIENPEYGALLMSLVAKDTFFQDFLAWRDVIAFMRDESSEDVEKNVVLRRIFEAHAEDRDSRWRTILLVIFWPGLKSVAIRYRNESEDENDSWGFVVGVFFDVICRIDVAKRPDRLVQKVINDTISTVRQIKHDEWERSIREISTDSEHLDINPAPPEVIEDDSEGVGESASRELFQKYMKINLIDETEFHLLVGTFVYGKSIQEYGEKAGISSEAAKKRRQRAIAKIRRYVEKKKNISRFLSPGGSF
ncbi:MAG: hypothetical protein V1809_01800 [Planctomycetota bacterium]